MRRYFLGGSGSDMFQDPRACQKILELIPKPKTNPLVLYLGTASYDNAVSRRKQTTRFLERNCIVKELRCTHGDKEDVRVYEHAVTSVNTDAIGNDHSDGNEDFPSAVNKSNDTTEGVRDESVMKKDDRSSTSDFNAIAKLISEVVDIILISGGNTLYAVDCWTKLGLIPAFEAARDRGVVLCGGSAGAICWFDGGHSDSGDPDSWLTPPPDNKTTSRNESADAVESWKYIRVPALGFLPGLCVPHGDKIQSNGVLRADDFNAMMNRLRQEDSSNERGIHIDHWAALVVKDDDYEIVSFEEKDGSWIKDPAKNDPSGIFSRDRKGKPAVWIKEIMARDVVSERGDHLLWNDFFKSSPQFTTPIADSNFDIWTGLAPSKGKLIELLVSGRKLGRDSEAVEACRKRNPPL